MISSSAVVRDSEVKKYARKLQKQNNFFKAIWIGLIFLNKSSLII